MCRIKCNVLEQQLELIVCHGNFVTLVRLLCLVSCTFEQRQNVSDLRIRASERTFTFLPFVKRISVYLVLSDFQRCVFAKEHGNVAPPANSFMSLLDVQGA